VLDSELLRNGAVPKASASPLRAGPLMETGVFQVGNDRPTPR